MNLLDTILLVILLVSAAQGYREGLIRGTIRLFGFLLSVIIAVLLRDVSRDALVKLLGISDGTAYVLGFIAVVSLTTTALFLVGALISRIISFTPVKWLDAAGGIVLGVLKGALSLSVLLVILSAVSPSPAVQNQIKNSLFCRPIQEILPVVIPPLKTYAKRLNEYFKPMEKVREIIKKEIEEKAPSLEIPLPRTNSTGTERKNPDSPE